MSKILSLLLIALAISKTLQTANYSAAKTQFCKSVAQTGGACTACHNEKGKKTLPKLMDANTPAGCTKDRTGANITNNGK